jgi:RNA recognition motif-containing protein
MRLFVGNLAWSITEEELERIFAPYGTVRSVHLITDRATGRSRGFGFVEMPYDPEAQDAIAGLHGIVVAGRVRIVSEAHPQEGRGGPRRSRA